MAENEKLDLGYSNSGRWRKWRKSFMSGKTIEELANEGTQALARTLKNLQRLFEDENGIPMKAVVAAATGEEGDMREILRSSRYGRDFLKLFELQSGQGFDARSIVEDVSWLIVDRFLHQIRQDVICSPQYPNGQSFQDVALGVKDEMVDGVQLLAEQVADQPDTPLRMPPRSAEQKQKDQEDLLKMSLLPDHMTEFHVTFERDAQRS